MFLIFFFCGCCFAGSSFLCHKNYRLSIALNFDGHFPSTISSEVTKTITDNEYVCTPINNIFGYRPIQYNEGLIEIAKIAK